jgi:hypothetical protein
MGLFHFYEKYHEAKTEHNCRYDRWRWRFHCYFHAYEIRVPLLTETGGLFIPLPFSFGRAIGIIWLCMKVGRERLLAPWTKKA